MNESIYVLPSDQINNRLDRLLAVVKHGFPNIICSCHVLIKTTKATLGETQAWKQGRYSPIDRR